MSIRIIIPRSVDLVDTIETANDTTDIIGSDCCPIKEAIEAFLVASPF